MNLDNYLIKGIYDEVLTPQLRARQGLSPLVKTLKRLHYSDLAKRRHDAELAISTMGITFTINSEAGNIDREWPYDVIPRIILQKEWERIEKGLIQRLAALNLLLKTTGLKRSLLIMWSNRTT